MKKLFLLLATPLLATAAQAQFQYNFSVQNGQTYTALPTTATTVNGTTAWDGQPYKVAVPFSLKLNATQTLTSLGIPTGSPGVADDTAGGPRNLFTAGITELVDKGVNTPSHRSKSPIRVATTGTAPNRIFKIEYRNAGFYGEPANPAADTVYNDSISVQYWFYETSSIVEFRYGPSHISAGKSYFDFGSGPSVGFVSGLDFTPPIPTINKAYYLTGLPNNPSLDSTSSVLTIGALTDYPASGTVYRFTPKGYVPPSTSVGSAGQLAGITVHPTAATGTVNIANAAGHPVRYAVYTVTGAAAGIAGAAVTGITSVDVSALPAGAYIVAVESTEGFGIYRFSKF